MDRPSRPGNWPRRARRSLAGDRRAATAVEYGLILALIVLTMFGGLAALGNSTSGMWNGIQTAVAAAH